MSKITINQIPDKYSILIVDDEPDIHSVTKLSLRDLRYGDRDVEFLSASSGTEALEIIAANPTIAVTLLDVVMETDNAGLTTTKKIRSELENPYIRILLRTGQPGQAPEKETIEKYDLDGYLPKAELSATRLFSSVRSALKSWTEVVQLHRHERYLQILHERALALHSYDPLLITLSNILEAALEICPASLGVLELHSFESNGNPQNHFIHLSTGEQDSSSLTAAEEIRVKISRDLQTQNLKQIQKYDDGILVPLKAHHELGYGWIFLNTSETDNLTESSLTMLAGHAANSLYSSVAESMLAEQEDDIDSLAI